MKRNEIWKTAAAFLLSTLLLLPSMAGAADELEQVDTRVLIDISGSMKENDPQNLRRSALRLLVGLLPAETRAGVWTFGQYVNMQIKLGVIDDAWKKRARAEAGKIHSRGLYTNIELALKRATNDWSGAPKIYRRSIILLTDGMVDVSKDASKDQQSRNRILDEIVPHLKSLGVAVHTIALSERADHELMRQLSESTGGWYEQVNSADRLQRVFLKMFEKVSRPDTVPLKDNRFTIDKSISEATLLIFRREGSEPSRIKPPKGYSFEADNAPSNVQWHRDRGYDLLTIKNPQAGEWSIQADMDPDNRVMIVTDLKMKSTALPSRMLVGEAMPIEVMFTEHGEIISKKRFLRMVNITSERWAKDGLSEPRPVVDNGQGDDEKANDGRFTFRFGEGVDEGVGELIISAKGATFVREQRQLYEILQPGFLELTPATDGAGRFNLKVTLEADMLKRDSIHFDAQLVGEEASSKIILKPSGEGVYTSQLDPASFHGDRQLKVKLTAQSQNDQPVNHRFSSIKIVGSAAEVEEPPPPVEKIEEATPEEPATESEKEDEAVTEEEPETGGGLQQALILFAAGNAILIIVGGGIYWFMRRKSKNPSLEDDEEIEDDD
ncbi:MAG: VWA domain-containing protein [Candidatus Polarisedimenticolaceae bacterium]|nr:VWA domain-containing protein [Candidatus Polarisedimenticolaceae bacterium]